MPFYEYECSSCKFYTEVMQKVSDTPLTKCPSCGKKALVKLISAPNFRLKGGGWYETDFKGDKENKRNLAGGDGEESSKSEPSKLETGPSSPASSSSSDSPKTESPKTETAKTDTSTVSTSSASTAKSSSSGASSAGKSSATGKSRSSTPARPAKPVTRVAASKARSSSVVRSKAKPAPSKKKKARR